MIKTICFDLDGVICDQLPYPKFGAVKVGASDALWQCKYQGIKVIIHTCRNKEETAEFMKENGLHYDYINENPDCPTENKPLACLYVDDRGYKFTDWLTFRKDFQHLNQTIPENIYYPLTKSGEDKR